MFKRLQNYQQEHDGSCNVPQRYRPDRQLGRWIQKQRYNYKHGLIKRERCEKLDEIGFEWKNNYKQSCQDQWNKMLKRLHAYQLEHDGCCNVPRGFPPDPELGRWVSQQRHCYKNGLLTKARCYELEKIGFERTRFCEWTKMLKRLQAYQQEHDGSCNVPHKYLPDPQLGIWVNTQRCRYKKGLLTKERCDRLEKIGFEWTRYSARTLRKLQPQLSTVAKAKQPGNQES